MSKTEGVLAFFVWMSMKGTGLLPPIGLKVKNVRNC